MGRKKKNRVRSRSPIAKVIEEDINLKKRSSDELDEAGSKNINGNDSDKGKSGKSNFSNILNKEVGCKSHNNHSSKEGSNSDLIDNSKTASKKLKVEGAVPVSSDKKDSASESTWVCADNAYGIFNIMKKKNINNFCFKISTDIVNRKIFYEKFIEEVCDLSVTFTREYNVIKCIGGYIVTTCNGRAADGIMDFCKTNEQFKVKVMSDSVTRKVIIYDVPVDISVSEIRNDIISEGYFPTFEK